MLEKYYEFKLKLAYRHSESVRKRREIIALYHSNDKDKKHISSSKLFLGFALGDFLIVQFFCMWFMYAYPEYSDLGSLIGIAVAILGQVGVVLGYFKKSTAENTVGGIVYDSAMQQSEIETSETVG